MSLLSCAFQKLCSYKHQLWASDSSQSSLQCSLKSCPSSMDDNPMLSSSVTIWKFMGFLAYRDKRRYIYLVPNSILNVLQLSFLVFSGEKVEKLILNSYFFVLYFNALVGLIEPVFVLAPNKTFPFPPAPRFHRNGPPPQVRNIFGGL